MSWRDEAACLGLDHRIFFPEYSVGSGAAVDYEPARYICWSCPVTEDCLDDALSKPRTHDLGVRGGFTAKERRNIRRKRSERQRRTRVSICHNCGAAGGYSITQRSCVRCGATYRPLPDTPCPNCQQREPIVGDECTGCGFTGRCRTCNTDTDFSDDPLYCDDVCRKQGETERWAFDRT